MSQKRLRVKILGRVQGVFYRSFVQKAALTLNLIGWVRNEADGSVALVAEGEKKNLQDFLKILKEGPDSATVGDLKIKWEKPKAEFEKFEIKY